MRLQETTVNEDVAKTIECDMPDDFEPDEVVAPDSPHMLYKPGGDQDSDMPATDCMGCADARDVMRAAIERVNSSSHIMRGPQGLDGGKADAQQADTQSLATERTAAGGAQCGFCGKSSKLRKCKGCGQVHYCGMECAGKHWNEHYKVCGKAQKR